MKRKLRSLQEVIDMGGLLDVPETAAILRVSQPSIYSWARKGKLPSIRLGDLALRFDPLEVRQFIDERRTGPTR